MKRDASCRSSTSTVADYPNFKIFTGQIIQQEIISQIAHRKRGDVKEFACSILLRTKQTRGETNERNIHSFEIRKGERTNSHIYV